MIPGEVESVACKGITDDSSIISWTVNLKLLMSEHLDTMSPVIRTNVRSDEINIYFSLYVVDLKLSRELFMTSSRSVTGFPLRMAVFIWRTKNVWGLQLIPAELETVMEAVSDVGDILTLFSLVVCRVNLEEIKCVII